MMAPVRGFSNRAQPYPGVQGMIVVVVQIPMRKDFLNGEVGGGGVYYWTSREAAEAWYTPAWRAKAKETFGAEPIITYYETYVTVDNIKGETIVREHD
jgi:hypothetical protein